MPIKGEKVDTFLCFQNPCTIKYGWNFVIVFVQPVMIGEYGYHSNGYGLQLISYSLYFELK